MNDTIYRQAAIDEIVTWLKDRMTDGKNGKPLTDRIKDLPSAQQKQKLGKWVDDGDPLTWACSECGYRVARYNNTPYCPRCGVNTRGEQDE